MNAPNMNPVQLAMMMLQQNPQKLQTPMGQQFMKALQTGDANMGAQMAMNFCNSIGKSPQEVLQMAQNTLFK